MGAVKAALPLRAPWAVPPGEPAAARILRLCGPLARRVVVLGHHAEAVRAVCHGADFAINPAPDDGMFSSVRAGLRVALQVQHPPAAVLVWPVDVPLVSVDSVRALFSAGAPGDAADAVWVRYVAAHSRPELPGHPVLLSRGVAQRVCEADAGARLDHLLHAPGVVRTTVLVDDPYVGIDLDTWASAAPYLHV